MTEEKIQDTLTPPTGLISELEAPQEPVEIAPTEPEPREEADETGQPDVAPPQDEAIADDAPPQDEAMPNVAEIQPIIIPPAPAADRAPGHSDTPSRSEMFLYVTAGSLLALVLAVVFGLTILWAINGDLSFVPAARFNTLQTQVDQVQSNATALQSQMDGLRTRLDNLEALGGRVSTLEQDAQTLRSDLNATGQRVDSLQQQTNDLSNRTNTLEQRSQVFQNFLDGLRSLLTNVVP